MNKTTLALLILVIFFAGGWRLLKQPETEGETIKIGAIYTLSGIAADIGVALQEGTEIALEEINSIGGINGRKVEIMYEDAPDAVAKGTINAAQKLIAIDNVAVVLDYPYSGLGAVQTIATQYKVPIFDVIDSSDEIATFGDWIFGGGVYADGVGHEVAQFARNGLSLRKVAMLIGKDEYLLAVAGGFEKSFAELGGTVVSREEFLIGATDFRTQLSKIKSSGAEAIFISHLGEGGVAVKQAVELGFKGLFLGSDTFSLADVKRAAGDLLNGRTYFALWRNFDALTKEQDDFRGSYTKKYGKDAGDYLFYHVLGYDGMMIVAEAMKNSDLSPEGIKHALYNIKNYQGLSGPITIDESGINRDPKSAIVMYQNGEIVRYKK